MSIVYTSGVSRQTSNPHDGELETRVRIYVVSDRDAYVPQLDYIQLLDPNRHDGDEIASFEEYSELRAHYWVWKNAEPRNHVGFFQFRRYLDLSGKNRSRPFYLNKRPETGMFVALEDFLSYDVVAPMAEYTGETVLQRYARTHDAKDMEVVRNIILDRYPTYERAMRTYLYGKSEYYCNLYLMRWQIFSEYCEWLFGILAEYTERMERVSHRSCGYVAERLFGIWYTQVRLNRQYRCIEVPRVHFWCFDDDRHHFCMERPILWLLPPGSRRRALFRKIIASHGTVLKRKKTQKECH